MENNRNEPIATLLDAAMVLRNIQSATDKSGSSSLTLRANFINTDSEYFMAQYGEPVYLNEDDEPVHFWEKYHDLRDIEVEVLNAANANGAFDKLEIVLGNEEDPAGLGYILKRPQRYEITLDPTGFERYINKAVALADDVIQVNARLSFENISTPAVEIGDKKYQFAPLRNGSVMEIILYCFENYANQQVSLSTLQDRLSIKGVTNIKETLRRSFFDSDAGLLGFFVESSSQSITVKDSVTISNTLAKSVISSSKLV